MRAAKCAALGLDISAVSTRSQGLCLAIIGALVIGVGGEEIVPRGVFDALARGTESLSCRRGLKRRKLPLTTPAPKMTPRDVRDV
jgi:hypothetical protein